MKKKSSLPTTAHVQQPQAAPDTRAFGRTFLIKDNILTPEPEVPDDVALVRKPFKSLHELDRIVMLNRKLCFGEQTIGLGAKAEGLLFPWEAFLFDWTDSSKPRCYLMTIALCNDPFEPFFTTMARIFGYMRNPDSRRTLINILTDNIQKDKPVRKAFEQRLGADKTIAEFIEGAISRCRVLLITDDDRPQYPDFAEAYPETWGTLLSVIYLRKYKVGKAEMISMHPTLAELQEKPKSEKANREKKPPLTEAEHLEQALEPSVRTAYEKIKDALQKLKNDDVLFNPQRYYISMKVNGGRNSAFFHIRKRNIYLVVMLPEKEVRKLIKKHEIKSLPDSVQKFWNGASTALLIAGTENLKEVIDLLKRLMK